MDDDICRILVLATSYSHGIFKFLYFIAYCTKFNNLFSGAIICIYSSAGHMHTHKGGNLEAAMKPKGSMRGEGMHKLTGSKHLVVLT